MRAHIIEVLSWNIMSRGPALAVIRDLCDFFAAVRGTRLGHHENQVKVRTSHLVHTRVLLFSVG